jgi:hypothetical protein
MATGGHRVVHCVGFAASVAVIVSCFFHWTWYPDLQKYFTGFFTENNYLGKPGILLTTVYTLSGLSYLVNKVWSLRLNLALAAIGMAYGVAKFLQFTAGYDGFVPEKQPAIFVMLVGGLLNLVAAIVVMGIRKEGGEASKC